MFLGWRCPFPVGHARAGWESQFRVLSRDRDDLVQPEPARSCRFRWLTQLAGVLLFVRPKKRYDYAVFLIRAAAVDDVTERSPNAGKH